MSEAAKWYVIHTYSGYENKVAKDIEKVVENRKLHDLIQEVQVPTEMVEEVTKDKNGKPQKQEVERKTFPSYVLLKMVYTDDTWHVIKNIRGVTGFVGPGSDCLYSRRKGDYRGIYRGNRIRSCCLWL